MREFMIENTHETRTITRRQLKFIHLIYSLLITFLNIYINLCGLGEFIP